MKIDLDKTKASELHALAENHQLDSLNISGNKGLTTDVSQYLKRMTSLRHLSVWTTMTRTALNDCLSISGLEILDIRTLSTPGNVIDTRQAKSLTTLAEALLLSMICTIVYSCQSSVSLAHKTQMFHHKY